MIKFKDLDSDAVISVIVMLGIGIGFGHWIHNWGAGLFASMCSAIVIRYILLLIYK